MHINKVHNTTDAYIALYRDLKFDIHDNIVTIHKPSSEDTVELMNINEYYKFFRMLSEFSITLEDINIITMRYGLDTGQACTLESVGSLYEVSDEQIRSSINKSFRKLKHRLNLTRTINRWEVQQVEASKKNKIC